MTETPETLAQRLIGAAELWERNQPACGELRVTPEMLREAAAALEAQAAQIAERDAQISAIEFALEALVNRCNHDLVLANDDAVISAEATLERLYRARRAAMAAKEPR